MKTCFSETSHFLPYEFHGEKNVSCCSFSLPEASKGMILTMPCFSYILLLFLTWKYLMVGLIISFCQENVQNLCLDTTLQYFPTEKSPIFQSIREGDPVCFRGCVLGMNDGVASKGCHLYHKSMDSSFFNNSISTLSRVSHPNKIMKIFQ